MGNFLVNKTIRKSFALEDAKEEVIISLQDNFNCEVIKDDGKNLEVSLVPLHAGKFVKSVGTVSFSTDNNRTKINFKGKHKWTGRSMAIALLSIPALIAGGFGILILLVLMFQINKGAKHNEKQIQDSFQDMVMNLDTPA
ncbi:hypothetical protein LCL98_17975 [Rossellomorea aquimaris]|nr:hypothetical protein [Rossellomorea aquimaris]